jgi:hypothetical protein
MVLGAEMIDYKTAHTLFHYDNDSGVLYRKYKKKICAVTTTTHKGYITTMVGGRNYRVHRLVWLMVYGEFPANQIDHINGIKSDNRIQNLRDVDNKENHKNMKQFSNNSSGHVGVTWDSKRNKWFVSITVEGKTKALGRFLDFAKAVLVRKSAEQQFCFHKNHGRKS